MEIDRMHDHVQQRGLQYKDHSQAPKMAVVANWGPCFGYPHLIRALLTYAPRPICGNSHIPCTTIYHIPPCGRLAISREILQFGDEGHHLNHVDKAMRAGLQHTPCGVMLLKFPIAQPRIRGGA